MNIHEHDDYEKLAKLFYPSIEASGNVYYGQTRKLTMDEILGKNDMGFESHIESVKKDYGHGYDKFFQWKIGPLQGSVKVGDLYDFPIAYAKYRLEITKNTVQNVVHSASFPTYENDVRAIFDGIEYTENSPIDGSLWDGRHFYVGGFNNVEYLYIPLVNYYADEEYTDLLHTPLCFTSSESSAADCLISLAGYKDDNSLDYPPNSNYSYYNFKYSYDNYTWSSYDLNTQLILHPGNSVYFKGNFSPVDDGYINFTISSQDDRPGNKLYISGNINSLIDDNEFFSISDLTSNFTPSGYIFPPPYMFQRLFETSSYDYNVTLDASNLKLPATTLSDYCYYRMFYSSAIVKAPDLIARSLARSCYESMFEECRLLRCTPYIWSGDTASNCYKNMFYQSFGGSSITYLNAYYDNNDASSIDTNWLYGVDTPGVFIDGGSGFDNIPNDWSYLYENEDPLTICNVKAGGVVRIRLVKSPGYSLSVDNEYQYRYLGDDDWVNLTLSVYNTLSNQYSSGDAIILSDIPIQVRCLRHNSNQTGFINNPENNKLLGSYVYFASQLPIEYDPSDDTVYDEPRICICGNVNSMISPDQYDITDISNYPYAFEYLFSGLQFVELVPNLYHTTLSVGCYCGMFESTSIITAPRLKCTNLSNACCYAMFRNCSGLEAMPDLKSLSLANSCYRSAFEGCINLIVASELPATELAESCYASMFEGCISLTKAPKLPATQLADSCYSSMFSGCTSLIVAPELPAGQLASDCYGFMFYGCNNLESVITFNSNIASASSIQSMLSNVNHNLTLYCNTDCWDESALETSGKTNADYWVVIDLYKEIRDGATDTPNSIDNNNDYRQPYMITSGSDSDQNGKGKLDGGGDYESSFDVNGSHPMGSYNPDGSYNQEIWGYKSFNSPVQFRNGAYSSYIAGDKYCISDVPPSDNVANGYVRIRGQVIDNNSPQMLLVNDDNNNTRIAFIADYTIIESDRVSIYANVIISRNVSISGNLDVIGDTRFVTCHAPGEDTTGEVQAIYGYKSFLNGIGTSELISTDDDNHGILVMGTLYPEDETSDIGTDENFFGTVYCNGVKLDSIEDLQGDGITLYSDIVPNNNSINLGNSSYYFNSLYTKNEYMLHVYSIDNDNGVTLHTDIRVNSTNTYSIGESTKKLANIYSNNIYASYLYGDTDITTPVRCSKLLPANNNVDIGESADRFKNIYCDRLDCSSFVGPTISFSDVPIGSLVVAYDPSWVDASLVAGKVVTSNGSNICVAGLDGTTAGTRYLPSGDYKLLSNSWTGAECKHALVIRIS